MGWIKASEKMPEVGRLVEVRTEEKHNDRKGKYLCSKWDYTVGLVKQTETEKILYVDAAYDLSIYLSHKNAEWQYVEE